MARNGGSGGGMSRTNYPNSPGEIKSCNTRSHVPFGPKMLDQSEKGRDAMAAAHGKVHDHGMMTSGKKHPFAKSSPIEGSTDLPYEPYDQDDF